MTLSFPIPQDVIIHIVDLLKDDPETLKACAAVSHAFLPYTQRHLFFSVRLRYSSESQRLFNILSLKPELALLIKKLHIVPPESDAETSWIATETSLPWLLKMLYHLQTVAVVYGYLRIPWGNLSSGFRSALIERLYSPEVSELVIHNIRHLPIFFMTHFTHLKRLSISVDSFDYASAGQPPIFSSPAHLQFEALELHARGGVARPIVILLLKSLVMPMLRHVSLDVHQYHCFHAAQEMIDSCLASIKSVALNPYVLQRGARLGMIHSLECLIFKITIFRGSLTVQRFSYELASLVRQLEDPAVTKALQELIIIVEVMDQHTDWDNTVRSSFREWEKLDSVCWSPVLKKVHVQVDFIKPLDIFERPQILLHSHLPQLVGRGVFSACFGDGREILDTAWSKVWY